MKTIQKHQYCYSGITDKMIAEAVSSALRHAHADIHAAVKHIERVTGISAVTASKWYNGIYAPKSRHLLILGQHYPEILQIMCELMRMESLWQEAVRSRTVDDMRSRLEGQFKKWKKSSTTGDRFVTIRVRLDIRRAGQLNTRQLWFLSELQQGNRTYRSDFMETWQVHERTAKRDIAGLIRAGLICSVKQGRQSCYELT